MGNKICRVVIYDKKLQPITSHDSFSHVFLWGHVTYQICCISTPTRPMDTKYGKLVTYHEGLQLIKSHDHLNKWFCEVTWQIRYIISPVTIMYIICIIKQAKQALILVGPSTCNFWFGMLLEKGVIIFVVCTIIVS